MRSTKFWTRSDFIDFFMEQPAAKSFGWDCFRKRHGLSKDILGDPHGTVPLSTFFAIFEEGAAQLHDDALFFDMLYKAEVGAFSSSDYIFVTAPDLRTAIKGLVDHSPARGNAISYIYRETDSHGCFEWRFPEGHGDWRQQMFARAAITVRQAEIVLGLDKAPLDFEIAAEPPKSGAAFLGKYRDSLVFSSPRNRLLVPRRFLDRPNPRFEPNLYRIIQRAAAGEVDHFDDYASNLSRVMAQIAENLMTGRCHLREVSRDLAISQRTLQRILEQENTTFRQLVERVRKSAAHRYILHTELPFKEIAYLLGFSELSTFSRAAKGWFGVSPSRLRRQQTLPNANRV